VELDTDRADVRQGYAEQAAQRRERWTELSLRLGIPLLRVGFPQYDLLGGFQRCWSGYRASAQALFDLANLLTEHHRGIAPYRSIYAQKPASDHSQWSH